MIILVGNVFEGVFGYFAVTTVLVLSLILLSIISSSLSAIFKVALYLYTRYGIMAEGFSSEIISSAIGKMPETS